MATTATEPPLPLREPPQSGGTALSRRPRRSIEAENQRAVTSWPRRRRGVGHEPKPSSVTIGLIRRVPMSHLVIAAGSCAAARSGSFSSLALPSGWRSPHAACPSSWLDRNCLSQWRPRQADDAAAGGASGRRVAAGPPTRLRGGLKGIGARQADGRSGARAVHSWKPTPLPSRLLFLPRLPTSSYVSSTAYGTYQGLSGHLEPLGSRYRPGWSARYHNTRRGLGAVLRHPGGSMQNGGLELIDFIGCSGGSKSTGKPCDGASPGSLSGEGGCSFAWVWGGRTWP